MRILVFEYVTGGGMASEPLTAALAREGEAMLGALLDDLLLIPGVSLVALRDARLAVPGGGPARIEWIMSERGEDAERRYRELIGGCDAAWPLAPETGGILERLCRVAEAAGKALLTCPASAVQVASSKLATARRLEAHGVPVVATMPVAAMAAPVFPVVVKPDDGAGCAGARVLETPKAWREFTATAVSRQCLAQPLTEGEALSLSALFAHGDARLLSVNRQRIARENGGFVLKGCGVNAVGAEPGLFEGLARSVAAALPELWGYAGIDLIRTEAGPRVLEINPRLTTSYAGIRASTGLNPAELVLGLWREGRLPRLGPARRDPVEIVLEPCHVH